MKFNDIDLRNLDLLNTDDFAKVFIEFLCRKTFEEVIIRDDRKSILEKIIDDIKNKRLNHEQFNEILLLLNQNRISKGFYDYFFDKKSLNFKDLKNGVEKFRGYSLLHFGNFKFTYRSLSEKTYNQINDDLCLYNEIDSEKYSRPDAILNTKPINKEQTCFLGYLSGEKLKNEFDALEEDLELKSKDKDFIKSKEFDEYKNFYDELKEINDNLVIIQKDGESNTLAYLIWDYLDVYIATSMRDKCEYEEVFEFINDLKKEKGIIQNLRIFDPTQSFCEQPRDKGLIEGLMLKRADCTIYMVQESDTIGKDSELAATLAQKKPVIAYVPDIALNELVLRVKSYPLDYIKKKILILKAEGIFDEPDFIDSYPGLDTKENIKQFNEKLLIFVKKLDDHRGSQPYTFWYEKEKEFIEKNNKDFEEICKILAIATKVNWDQRAKILREFHPLSMQIDINTGVANGVIVVRNISTCAKVLVDLLTRKLSFEIRKEEKYTGLFEKTTNSLYRIVTNNQDLTNSFWNFFFPV